MLQVTETALKSQPHKYSKLVTDGGAPHSTVAADVCAAKLVALALGNRTGQVIDASPGSVI